MKVLLTKAGTFPAILSLLIAGMLCFFTGCGDDEGDAPGVSSVTRIDGRLENGANYNTSIDSVKLFFGRDLARASYSGGSFTLNLPASLPENTEMNSIENLFSDGDFKLEFSDKKAQYLTAIVRWEKWESEGDGEDQNSYRSGYGTLRYGNPERDITATLVYVDRDVTVTGGEFKIDDEGIFAGDVALESVSISFRRGWNFLFRSSTSSRNMENSKVSTTNPGGVSWYHQNDW